MKTIEEIEKEYESFNCVYEVHNLEELHAVIEQHILSLNEDLITIRKEYKNNRKDKFFANIKNKLLFFVFLEEEIEYYDEELDYLMQLSFLAELFTNYLEQILLYSDDSNYEEMNKLLSFMTAYYQSNSEYVDSELDSLEYKYQGYCFVNNREEDNSKVVDEFFMKKIKELSNGKPVEKNIYLCYHK